MNCESVNFILDTKSAADFTAAERQAVDQHLSSCPECREAWEAYDELATLQIPPTPQHLRVRIAASLVARAAAERNRARRNLIVGAVFIAGAAVAATAALRWSNRPPDPVQTIEEVVPAVKPIVPAAPESPAASDEPVPNSREPVVSEPIAPSAEANGVAYPLDPYSLVVVAVQDPDADRETAEKLARCYGALVEELRRGAGLNVIAGEQLRMLTDYPGAGSQAARELGAGSVLALSVVFEIKACMVTWNNLQTGAAEIVAFSDQPGESWRAFIERAAEKVRQYAFKDKETINAEMRLIVLDTARSDNERLNELYRLRPDPAPPTTFDEATVAAAVQIGLTSRDVNMRAKAWGALIGVTDPQVVQPLLYALENDAEPVRARAALALATFGDQPVVKEALTRAAAEVPSESPKCCSSTVRSAARLALRADDEPAEAVRKTLLDESLTPQERLVFTPPASIAPLSLRQLGDEAAQAVFALGSSSDDDEVRSRAWSLLGGVSDRRFVSALREDLVRHPVERVRAAAAAGLTQHRADPDVRAALERAAVDSSPEVQRAAQKALDGVVVGF